MASKLKILYVHGLESGPCGRKFHALKQDFDVYSPDMQMSILNIKRKNSFACKAIRQHALPLIIVVVMLIFAIICNGYYKYILMALIGLYILIILIFHKKWIGFIVSSSLNQCVAIINSAILEFKPDLIYSQFWLNLELSKNWFETDLILI